jgi:hypothetical protein
MEWKRIQHSMALEGWGISDKSLKKVALNYEAQGMDRLAQKIAEQSNKTKKPLSEVAKEVMDEFWKRKAHLKHD